MPTAGNPKRTVRMTDESWAAFVDACDRADVQPAVMLRTLAEWYYRKPGVTIRRPDPQDEGRRGRTGDTPTPEDHD